MFENMYLFIYFINVSVINKYKLHEKSILKEENI